MFSNKECMLHQQTVKEKFLNRRVLLMQGPATPFFRHLSCSMTSRGYDVVHVSFCGGDLLFTLGRQQWLFREKENVFPDWLDKRVKNAAFTDMVMFGDARPLHKYAIRIAHEYNIKVHVFEEGYFRPDWVTFERNGVNAFSNLMDKDVAWYHNCDELELKTNLSSNGNFFVRLWYDLLYHLANVFLFPLFFKYKTHRPHNALIEYLGWVRRYPKLFLRWRREKIQVEELVTSAKPYFFFPLQLNSDSQIREHSPFANIPEAIWHVMGSFAKHAPADSLLVLKNHPLDTGLVAYETMISALAKSLGIDGRIIYLENGHIPSLVSYARGTVTINSTVGTSALFHHCPLCVLGKAIYALSGLVAQQGLDQFWTKPIKPDPVLFEKFKAVVISMTQVNGNFYSKKGIGMAIQGALDMMELFPIRTGNADTLTSAPLINRTLVK